MASNGRKVAVVVAHPDDETFGFGSLIAHSAALGAEVVVCAATRGEMGEDVRDDPRTGDALGADRERELRAAAALLGASAVELFGFSDSGMNGDPPSGSLVGAPFELVAARVGEMLVRHRPDVVVTMDPDGLDGHRDHERIGQATIRAYDEVVTWPARLYHLVLPRSLLEQWVAEHRARDARPEYTEIEMGRPDDDVTTVVDVSSVLELRRRAMALHASQVSPFADVSESLAREFLTRDHLRRLRPEWDGGPAETHIFG
jgi:LmbE family N-acetylglucosaminyl deacetylase